MYERQVDLRPFAQHRSLFLLGPRQTGKSTLLKNAFPEALYIDLLDDEAFRRFAAAPKSLRHAVQDHQIVVIAKDGRRHRDIAGQGLLRASVERGVARVEPRDAIRGTAGGDSGT